VSVGRREFVRRSAAATAGWIGSRAALRAQPGVSPDLRDRVSRLIAAYDAQGIHRTATEVDARSAEWLLTEVRHTGADAAREPFALSRVDLRACFIEAGGRRIDGLPLFDGTFTGPQGIDGRLGLAGSDAEIALFEADAAAISSEGRAIADLRRSAAHQAVVVATRGAGPGLTPMNAASFRQPFGVPVLQVAGDEWAGLQEQARRQTRIHVVAHAERTRTEAANVVATVRGGRADLPPVIVMTPRSGWWQCASERGGGLACWLEAMRAVAAASPTRSVTFVASSGHELGHLGLESFLERRHELVRDSRAWIHLGANIGAAGGRLRLQASDDNLETLFDGALQRVAVAVAQRVPRGTMPAGEARNIHIGGGRYVSLLGSGPLFHSPADRWPAAVDVALAARCAAAVAQLVGALAEA
jgi:hypothetical protein